MSVLSDNNSCLMTAKFDFGRINKGKHGPKQEIYRLNSLRMTNAGSDEADYGFDVVETKNKVRGHGKTLVLRFESSTGKDFELLGWSTNISGNSQP